MKVELKCNQQGIVRCVVRCREYGRIKNNHFQPTVSVRYNKNHIFWQAVYCYDIKSG